ncbi:hypothetical protein [Ideonella sp.]|uniref:hypothetical protein n=1 Tax=Ideonella sp. TaxID=1929293 RepID=UPI002B4A9FE0|nr:hypothetical protein [Ideonella sp.]HJV70331.1 hypothetical protein [Ideonella sp.]
MRKELIVKSRSLVGTSDLTLLAPICPGLVPGSLEAVTYKTRIKRLLEALSVGRATSHEFALLRPFSDAVERVGKIHSVRVTVFEPEDKVLLAVSFDGTWEAYIRVLWQRVGALLDAIFCNTEGYVLAAESPYEAWAAWVDKVQRETCFYYGMPGLTVDDVHALRKEEALHRRRPASEAMDVAATRQTVRSAEDQAWDAARHTSPAALIETGRQALQSLSFVHRLTSLYPPGTPDGRCLKRAARELLREFIGLAERSHLADVVMHTGMKRFDEQLAWLLTPDEPPRRVPALPAAEPAYDKHDVQAGIVGGYADVTHGCLALLRVDSRAGAAALLRHLRACVTPSDVAPGASQAYVNVAFTYEGLRALGLGEAELETLPLEFRQGMEARASMLGDFRHNHPRRWRRPPRWNGLTRPTAPSPGSDGERVDLATVHAVVQFRARLAQVDLERPDDDWVTDKLHAIGAGLAALDAVHGDVHIVSIEPMRRHRMTVNGASKVREHFGFADGESDPSIAPTPVPHVYDNQVHLGELLLGYDNQADFAADAPVPPLLKNGSFLVVRKLRQDVAALDEALSSAVQNLPAGISLGEKQLLERMMGRAQDGQPLVPGRGGNDFDFGDDPMGRACPFHSHVRRANPRPLGDEELPMPPGERFPRLARRGMSYGPTYDRSPAPDPKRNQAERGLVFMAYNARIGEQFEVVQRWLTGGNSSGGYSGQSDPFIGVAPNGQKRFFRFEDGGRVVSIALDGAEQPLCDPRPFVQVEWGAYLFAPSISSLDRLGNAALGAGGPVWSAQRGLELLAALPWSDPRHASAKEIDDWKAALEDAEAVEKFQSADLWAAMRGEGGRQLVRPGAAAVPLDGVLRSPYGVLVTRPELARQVLSEPACYSVGGYRERMAASIGEIFLGQDPDTAGPADPKVKATNQAIMALTSAEGFELCFAAVSATLARMTAEERGLAGQTNRPRWELNLNLREVTDEALQRLCQEWFGLEPPEFLPGAQRWDLDFHTVPRYPGHFMPPSRYIFQPHPGDFVVARGQAVGRRLTEAMRALVQRHHDAGTLPRRSGRPRTQAPIPKVVFAQFAADFDVDQVARYLVGVLMGMLPTLEGNLGRVMDEWLRDGSFWRLRQQLLELAVPIDLNSARRVLLGPLADAMRLRPSPELIWRTATTDTLLGGVEVRRGDKVVVSQVACTHAQLAGGSAADLSAVFGGHRKAAVQPAGEPTHACPGYMAAMGALLGTLAGLLGTALPMRPSPARLAVNFEGPTFPAPPVAAPPKPLVDRDADAQMHRIKQAGQAPAQGWLLAEGDSWFDDIARPDSGPVASLLGMLEQNHQYRAESLAQAGDSLKDLLCRPQIDAFTAKLRRMVALGRPPRFILLSAGGNDVVQEKLLPLVHERSKVQGTQWLVTDVVEATVGVNMAADLKTLIGHYIAICRSMVDAPVPIFIHGYDYPVPDGRNLVGVAKSSISWLYPVLATRLHYGKLVERKAVMQDLIDCLNVMQDRVANELTQGGWPVGHIDLRGTLDRGAGYQLDWANELHPTAGGFAKLAARVSDWLDNYLLSTRLYAS